MSDDDFTVRLKSQFDDGGIYSGADEPDGTLRGSLTAQPGIRDLPLIKIGDFGDRECDFALGRKLGEGGVGVVSLAHQNALQRDVALKRIREKDRDDRELLHEALMMGMVEHPNVVPVHLVGRDTTSGAPVIVMKHVEGVTWAEVMREPHTAPANEVADLDYHLRVLLQLCNAVRYAHQAGVLHLDIKPDNVMLGAFGEVYLADWGISTRVGPGGAPQSGSIRGTPAYMAPEMTNPEDALVDVRTDVFLLGATLHRVITGRRLHDAESPMDAVRLAHEYEAPFIPGPVDDELSAIIETAVSKDPDDRYGSVDEFQRALREYVDHREAISLANIAEDGIDELARQVEEGGNPDSDLLAETRFALRRALQIWPESPESNVLRARLANLIFDWALASDDVKEAERARSWLPEEERSPLDERLEAARELLRKDKEALEELRSLRDQDTARTTRLIIGCSAGLLWLGIAAYKGWKRYGVPLDQVDPNYLWSLVPTFVLPVALIIAFRWIYGTSEFNKRVILFLSGGMFAVALTRLTGWALDLHAYVTTAMEFIIYATLVFLFGLLVDLRVTWASAVLFAVAILSVLFPGYQYVFMTVGFGLFGPYIAWVWSVSGRAA